MMTVGSLFAGIGGIELGLERAGGFKTVWQVEQEEYARKVLAKHWPDAARYRDVRFFLGSKRWRQAREAWAVDVICGGFPCQDISNAGKRAGIDGSRSGLWSEYARIVRLLRPRYVVVENVRALLIRGVGRVLGDLAGMGYDAEWFSLPAAAVGAPHQRWRLFIVAYQRPRVVSVCDNDADANDKGLEGRVCGIVQECAGERTSRPIHSHDSSNAASGWQGQRGWEQFAAYCKGAGRLFWPDAVAPVCGISHGVPHRVDRLKCLGNAVVPQLAEWIGRLILEKERTNSDFLWSGGR